MGDKETGSEWSHILGQAQAGPLKGKRLKIIPSSMTSWRAWREKHPQTTVVVVERTAMSFRTKMLEQTQRFGVGMVENGQARLWRFDQLQRQPLVNDIFQSLPVVIHFDTQHHSPMVWNRKLANEIVEFVLQDGVVRDLKTLSGWDLQRGIAIDGQLAGAQLNALPAIVTFRSAWKRFHPKSTHWLANSSIQSDVVGGDTKP